MTNASLFAAFRNLSISFQIPAKFGGLHVHGTLRRIASTVSNCCGKGNLTVLVFLLLLTFMYKCIAVPLQYQMNEGCVAPLVEVFNT